MAHIFRAMMRTGLSDLPEPMFPEGMTIKGVKSIRLIPSVQAPNAAFTADPVSGTAPLLVQFTDSQPEQLRSRTCGISVMDQPAPNKVRRTYTSLMVVIRYHFLRRTKQALISRLTQGHNCRTHPPVPTPVQIELYLLERR